MTHKALQHKESRIGRTTPEIHKACNRSNERRTHLALRVEPENSNEETEARRFEDRYSTTPIASSPAVRDQVERLWRGERRGDALPQQVRAPCEHLGMLSLTDIRVHSNSVSRSVAQKMNAKAFTIGHNIFLGRSQGKDTAVSTLVHEMGHSARSRNTNSGSLPIHRKVLVAGQPLPRIDLEDRQWQFILNEVTGPGWSLTKESRRVPAKIMLTEMVDSPAEMHYETVGDFILDARVRMGAMSALTEIESANPRYAGYEPYFSLPGAKWIPRYPLPLGGRGAQSAVALYGVRTEVSPAAAVDSIFTRTSRDISLECNTMLVATQYKGILDSMGVGSFDVVFGKDEQVIISHFAESNQVKWNNITIPPSSLQKFYDRVKVKVPHGDQTRYLIPGDWVYFKNSDAYAECGTEKGWDKNGLLWLGEHTLYMGGKEFLGFGLEKNYTATSLTSYLGTKTEKMCSAEAPCDGDRCTPPGLDQGDQTTMVYRLNPARLRRFVLRRLGEHLLPTLVSDDSQG